jgi:hypothetical protein
MLRHGNILVRKTQTSASLAPDDNLFPFLRGAVLSEIEHLLRRRVLPVCVCSPTLAQGLDLCFGVLLFKSIYRNKDTVPAKEFANVIGRVGRAFVDLDGVYVFPIFEKEKRETRVKAFRNLIREAQKRQLESGVRDLIGMIINLLTMRLRCNSEGLAEYVLNLSSSWELPAQEGDDSHAYLEVALNTTVADRLYSWLKPAVLQRVYQWTNDLTLAFGPQIDAVQTICNCSINELDTAIFGVVDVLDSPTGDVADYLDRCLESSFWQRRLSRTMPEARELQTKVIRGRAIKLWATTTATSRRAYFASGVGFKARSEIEQSLDALREHMSAAEDAIVSANVHDASESLAAAGDILYKIGPFRPDYMVADLPALIEHWLSGRPLSECRQEDAVAFIHDHVVYRLVWAIEAARLHLLHLRGDDPEPPGGILAMCLTYGAPGVKASLLMQAGVRSRSVACEAAAMIEEDFTDYNGLARWVARLRSKEVGVPSGTMSIKSRSGTASLLVSSIAIIGR